MPENETDSIRRQLTDLVGRKVPSRNGCYEVSVGGVKRYVDPGDYGMDRKVRRGIVARGKRP